MTRAPSIAFCSSLENTAVSSAIQGALRSLEAARLVVNEAASIAGARNALHVEISGDRMLVQGQAVPVGARAFDQLHAELDNLGLSDLQVDAAAAPEHWHQLAKALRQQ